ncbi:MAG: transglutaminase family protein [Verrucomicrobiales bacterium]|nr:transglutaminase family protein [Verrucomicrobiales bacterium]
MSIHVALYHRTSYTFDREITVHPHVVRLKPAPHCRTPILSYSLRVQPDDHFINWQQDPFGNYLGRLVFPEKTKKLEFIVDLVADLTSINPFDFFLEEDAEEFPFTYTEGSKVELAPYLRETDQDPLLDELVAEFSDLPSMRTIDFLIKVNQRLEEIIDYRLRLEAGVQTCGETLSLKSGSCRDSAFLLCQVFRKLGIASRFVSGYLVQLSADEKSLDGPSGPTQDFTDLHAWTEVYLPGAGWVGMDPTSGLMAGEGHIPLACTPEPSSAAPVVGSIEACETEFDFENIVTRVHEDPRVTKPYTESEWKSVKALGDLVDKKLVENDVRLTMGGEPTFVSIDDMEGEEWNTTADSPAKRERAIDLTWRLRDAFAKGGLIWFGEGKWYPGEPVPRWAYGIFWRKDGYPMWRENSTQEDPARSGSFHHEDAGKLTREIAAILRISDECVIPACEDIEYYHWKLAALPAHEEPEEYDEETSSLERKTIARLEKRGLEVPTGYVLPIFVSKTAGRWAGAVWKLKRETLYLIPGASAMGFRLPLDSIREATAEDVLEERSPMEEDWDELDPNPLSPYMGNLAEVHDAWIPRTAVSVECRDGRLHVFMPPVALLEEYLQLLAAIELAAQRTGLKVVIEGYEPPRDPRIEVLKVTPDPGVIEVNVHPAASWRDQVENTETLYEAAKQARLGAEKFMIDGRHTGTGGGNHVVVGASTPAESPFLRRPDVLASLVAYWQHHPGLSYLFSGLFIGPTSQAPRVDEGRDDRLFELDIALETLHRGVAEPYLVDRTLRNLLTDLTGNTHRAEICIDKLYSPDSKTGQLGLLELRGFEMPPHRQMALVQSLLVRALIAMFWKRPYRHKCIRWGTTLHDRFLLPHYVKSDVREVCDDLADAGFNFSSEWLEPFVEFRFPCFGLVRRHGFEMEIRTALEPWHVLGEESTASGTSRFVDSSVERLQIKVKGLVEGRHIVTCNGRRVPLHPGTVKEEWIGGIRFKAWNPPSSLHPSIGAQSQLVIDIIDTRNKKSLGGCVYHVGHPGGRSYETFPVNAREAEARRLARFWHDGHTPGVIETTSVEGPLAGRFVEREGGRVVEVIPPENESREFPHTLDLRTASSFQAIDFE